MTLTFTERTTILTELVNAQAVGWSYCGQPEPGSRALKARNRARRLRNILGWDKPRPDRYH